MKRKIKLDNTCWHVWLRERNGKELITSWDLGRHSRYYTWHWLWGVAQIFYLKRILLRHLRGNLRTDISNVFSFSETQWTEYSWLANPFLFSDRTSRLTTLITLSESQNEFIQRNCLLRNQNYLYAFRLKYLVWRKTICRKKKAKLRTLLFDSRNQLSRHALKARTRAFIRGLIASIIPKWLDKILQIEVQSFKKRQRRAKD